MFLYSRANGKSRRIAGTGTVVPGEGVIANLVQLDFNELNAALNDHGQIAFVANVSDGSASRTALIVATPGNGAK